MKFLCQLLKPEHVCRIDSRVWSQNHQPWSRWLRTK